MIQLREFDPPEGVLVVGCLAVLEHNWLIAQLDSAGKVLGHNKSVSLTSILSRLSHLSCWNQSVN